MFVKLKKKKKKKDCVSRAHKPNLLKHTCLQPVLHKRSRHNERSVHGNWRVDH